MYIDKNDGAALPNNLQWEIKDKPVLWACDNHCDQPIIHHKRLYSFSSLYRLEKYFARASPSIFKSQLLVCITDCTFLLLFRERIQTIDRYNNFAESVVKHVLLDKVSTTSSLLIFFAWWSMSTRIKTVQIGCLTILENERNRLFDLQAYQQC